MFLYNLTLQRSTGITHAVHGNFSGTKEQEIVASRGKVLELLKLDPNTGKIQTLLSVEIFGIIRSMVTFRLAGTAKDYLIIGSDSGSIVIIEYNPQKNAFEKVNEAAFGKSGCRRTVPGQYLAVDPRGRALMIGAIEKQKLIYIVDHSASHLTISPPLEVKSPNTIVYDMVGIDVGFGNPVFACLEMDYEKSDSDPSGEAAQKTQQALTFYELDLGLNHIVRKYSEPLEEHGNFLISVPGGSEGPGGVLVCSENYITYKNFGDQPDIHCPIPRRRNDLDCPERGIIFVCSAVCKAKTLCFLAQTEQGDIFKITLEAVEDIVTELKLKYFDTVPVASAMCILKRGFLFVAAEFGNHFLYQIARLGDDDDEPVFSSVVAVNEGDTFFFAPRALKNLIVLDELESLSPIMCCHIADLANEGVPQVYIACGRGPRSSLRVLRHGLEVSEVAVFELPGNPNAVWTLKRRVDEEYHAYIILSFINATLVLSIGKTVEEVTDSGFLGATPTLACAQMGHDALVQIYPEGIHHVSANKIVWCTPKGKTISTCAVNQRQVVVALNGGELVYFEMDMSGKLNEYAMKAMPADVLCMALADVPVGKRKCMFLAVGLVDETVRVLSLDSSECLNILSMQSPPESLAFVEVGGRGQSVLYLNIGLQNGILLRTVLDHATGDLSDTCTKYLGVKPVKLFKASMLGNDAVIAMSSQSWLIYYHQNRLHVTPLSYETLEYASGFVTRQVSAGIVALSSNTLRILSLERLGGSFSQVSTPLEYTPKKFVIHPENNYLYLIQTDHNAYTEKTKVIRKQQMAEKMPAAFITENLSEVDFGAPKGGPGSWASMIAVINPVDGRTLHEVKLEQNEAAFSICLVRFASQGEDLFLLVGIAKDLNLNPHHCVGGIINTYRVASNGKELEFVHKTEVDEVPTAICPFQGRVLIGVGKYLRIYDLGKKKLLRKCENKHIPNQIVTIHSTGNHVIVGDTQESFYYVRYKSQENQLAIFADDTNPRWTTAACLLDSDTIAGADRFGNVYVLRLPPAVSDENEEEPVDIKARWGKCWLSKCSQKAEIITNFHVGEVVLSLQKATLTPGGPESLVYMTLSGTVGVLMPFTTHEDHDFFQNLEMHMRSENPPLCGRDHLSFRSLHFAVKNVIDGDLCEQYDCLDPAKQKAIAENLQRSPIEVSKKMEDMRTRYAF